MPNECPALRPPVWAEKYRWHWIEFPWDRNPVPTLWVPEFKMWLHGNRYVAPWVAAEGNWRYIGPADPSARVIDPENEAMVECVTLALFTKMMGQGGVVSVKACHDLALATFTALKEMP